jgi:hypothetical protein
VSVDLLRLDYDRTVDLVKTLTDVRFKLLALVPTVSGAAIGLLGRPGSAAELLGVGALGLTATTGILLYELRNTELYAYAVARAAALERDLELPSGGLYAKRPRSAANDSSLSLVYGAAIGGWSYLVTWGVLHALGVGRPRLVGGVLGALVGGAVVFALWQATARRDEPAPRAALQAEG